MFEHVHRVLAFASRMDSHALALHTDWYLGPHGIPGGRTGRRGTRAAVRSVTGGWESGAFLERALSS